MPLAQAHPSTIAASAEAVRIPQRGTSERTFWTPNAEQLKTWALMKEHHRWLIAKPRKTGISTATLFDDVLWTNAADDEGNRVRTVFAIDSADKCREHFERAEGWARELKLECTPKRSPPQALVWPNGSRLDFLTMGTDEPGRGGDIFRLHVTELPYAPHPETAWHALRSACMDNAPMLIETTMTSLDQFTVDFWRGQKTDDDGKTTPVATDFRRHFFSVTDQASYRLPQVGTRGKSSLHRLRSKDAAGVHRVGELTEPMWAMALRNGFKEGDREAAAWWLLEALPNLCNGELLTLMHDYPQHEPHLFVATSGRVIEQTPQIATVVARHDVHGMSGKTWTLELYVKPKDCSGSVYVCVDTAGGKGKTRSVVMIVDIADARILGCFSSNRIEADDLARIAQLAWHLYGESDGIKLGRKKRCEVLIEMNGIGQWTCAEAVKIGLPHTPVDQVKVTNDHKADACVRYAKRAIETLDHNDKSVVHGPPELAKECDTLKKERGELIGDKDLVMMLGMALIKRYESGVQDDAWKAKRYNIHTVHVEDRMAEEAAKAARQGWRPFR